MAGVLGAGAYGCVARSADDEELLLAIRTVARGGLHISPGLAAKLHTELEQPATTPRPPSPAARPRHSAGSPPG
ncbi:hypothetical protein NKH18_15020 [Streptomyces sp. M10(2022)]